ncbi:ASCH domain-containing protein [Sporosarcina trichiuri]|uniref:ASCH domain-containing protein n=1 Tax=Sporosarcina trichiuri TaxID=3056445 RepID=UPI0025B31621|nr:ASCH domain-containing protein [Sporosarcina sp. 0.2-SM1T-5]WJY27513.1 ASCH domain-containing protein [Sporosarcina sp. 0.2-SM1T-5]
MIETTVQNYWNEFRAEHPGAPETVNAWGFGDSEKMADELAALVVQGVKTATASNYKMYELGDEPLPKVGQYDIVLDGSGAPAAIIRTTAVDVMPFCDVPEEHAFLEGEGDRSLGYWRRVHEDFFKRELEAEGLVFDERIPVVCERFEVVDVRGK